MDIGSDFIGLVKTNTKVVFKETIKSMIKDWTGGCYLMFKSKQLITGYGPLVSIGYKYNSRKVISLIST